MGCIQGVIQLKISADKHVIHLIIALKTDFRVITYMKKKIHPLIPKLLKMSDNFFVLFLFFLGYNIFLKKNPNKKSRHRQKWLTKISTSWSMIFDLSYLSQNKLQTPLILTQAYGFNFVYFNKLINQFVYTFSFVVLLNDSFKLVFLNTRRTSHNESAQMCIFN